MRRLIIGLALVMLLLATVSCGRAPSMEEGPITMPEEAAYPTSAPPVELRGDGEYTTTTVTANYEERMIVRTGDMSLIVKDINQAVDEITQLAAGFDGYVVSSSISGEEDEMRGWISIRVVDEKFDQALAELRALAVRVKSENTDSRDVTQEYTDLQARLNNAEATEKQYLALLEEAADVEDILKIYDSLSRVRQEIEQIKGQMQYLERTASMSLISVYLRPEASEKPLVAVGWSALEILKSAVRGIIVFGQWLAILAIWLIIFIPIWGTVLGIIYWRRRRRKKRKA
jgi:hypothetical protein